MIFDIILFLMVPVLFTIRKQFNVNGRAIKPFGNAYLILEDGLVQEGASEYINKIQDNRGLVIH